MGRAVRGAWIIVSLFLAACGGGGGTGCYVVGPCPIQPKPKIDLPPLNFPPPIGYSITGTDGKRWKGSETITQTGTVPAGGVLAAPEKGKTVRVTIQKDEPGAWTLTLCVEANCRTTTAEFGSVTVEVTG